MHHAPEQTALAARRTAEGWTLSGTKRAVLDGVAATLFVVVARTSGKPGERDGLTLFLCPADAPGLSRAALRQIDSRGDAIVTFDGVTLGEDAVLGPVGGGHGLLEHVLDRGRAALAAEMLGASLQAFETTIDYLKIRVQFDQPIGSFQALQHRAADMVGHIELTRSAVEAALAAIDADSEDVPALASLAKAMAGKTMRAVAREMVQMHGGIGMTDEHDAGLYLKRAQAADVTFGNVAFHRERYARLAGF
jgi:alkylation response protein AidB-like acyl-CoA dehydrogenase